jgi:hypothetical protein
MIPMIPIPIYLYVPIHTSKSRTFLRTRVEYHSRDQHQPVQNLNGQTQNTKGEANARHGPRREHTQRQL